MGCRGIPYGTLADIAIKKMIIRYQMTRTLKRLNHLIADNYKNIATDLLRIWKTFYNFAATTKNIM